FRVAWGWPAPLALLIVLLVLAPLSGVLIERVLIRTLARGAPDVAIVVTLGLLLALMGIAQQIWDVQTTRILPPFFGNTASVDIAGVIVTVHQIIVVLVALAVAVGLR